MATGETFTKAVQYHQAGELQSAERIYQALLRQQPKNAAVLHRLGVVAHQTGRSHRAAQLIRQALQLQPTAEAFHNDLGAALQQQKRLDEAVAAFRTALQLKPDYVIAHNNLGNATKELGQLDEAIACFRRALRLRPNFPDAHFNLGNTYTELGRLDEAIACYRRALELRPRYAKAHSNLGHCLRDKGQLDEAIACYRRALELKPDHAEALAQQVHAQQHICDWRGLPQMAKRVIASVSENKERISPFVLLALPSTAAQQHTAAQNLAASFQRPDQRFTFARHRKPRITLGYLSADFHEHATAYLTAELFERHDRDRFRVIGYSFGPDDRSAMRRRLGAAFDEFVDIRTSSFEEAAQRIHRDEVDILIDLKGYTRDARTEIVARRPAPVQVNYLGYPGTMGADFIDYVVVDDFVVPSAQQPHFSERLVHLPGSYQVNDTRRPVSERTPSRGESGLPDEGFVFCCFNHTYKITPHVFASWMRLLDQVPASVLWLLESNPFAAGKLRCEAAARGVDPARLIFATKQPNAKHLARIRNADLFLDSWPCNAHTTASDALWVGCPVLTCAGETFASRVAGSLLRAVGLQELITESPDDYERVALELARDPQALAGIRDKLQGARTTSSLFDSRRFARYLEAAYQSMWDHYLAGRPPQPISVPECRGTEAKGDARSCAGRNGGSGATEPVPAAALGVQPPRQPVSDSVDSQYSIWIVSPPGYRHSRCFQEVAIGLRSGLGQLGFDAEVITDPTRARGTTIVLGAHLIPRYPIANLPRSMILFNLEQIDPQSTWLTDEYLELLRQYPVWDYSSRNIDQLRARGISDVRLCEIGYAPELTCIEAAETENIDVLLYGSPNDRRSRVLSELKRRGLRVRELCGVYGRERDDYIARAKIVLNVHYYEAAVFEVVRVSYLLANGRFVISETGRDTELEEPFRKGVVFASYERLADVCQEYLEAGDEARDGIARQGQEIMRGRGQAELLAAICKPARAIAARDGLPERPIVQAAREAATEPDRTAAAARELYLDLMQKCLTNTIYADRPQDQWSGEVYRPELRERGMDWPSAAHTMIGVKRMANVRKLTEYVLEHGVPGDLIETGVWRGGACIFMRAILKAYGATDRTVWCADSFEGLPQPDPRHYPPDAGDIHHTYEQLAISLEQVQSNFEKYDLLDDQVRFLKGWFEDTLHRAPIERLALLRLDGDMYESTIQALEALYDKLSPGGFTIIDDYGPVPACRKAVHDFRKQRSIVDRIQQIDGMGVYWQKSE